MLFHEHYTTNISEKYSPLHVLMSFQNYFGFFRTSTFRDIWRKIPRFILKFVCWFTLAPLPVFLYSLVGLVGRVFAFCTGSQWIRSLWAGWYFLYLNNTLENSKIYCEQLTSEHFLPYNYRSSTLPVIYRNIGWLLQQCVTRLDLPENGIVVEAYCRWRYATLNVKSFLKLFHSIF